MSLLRQENPHPQSALHFSNPFELLCAVMLSAQTTDEQVNRVTPALFARAPDAQILKALPLSEIEALIRTLGLWKNKALHLKQLAEIVADKYHNQVPAGYDQLIALPGVGSKTALVVLNLAFHQPTIAVDTHIFRLCNRSGFCLGKTAEQVQRALPELVDAEFAQDAHHYLLLHGRHVCQARKPRCAQCVVRALCQYPDKLD